MSNFAARTGIKEQIIEAKIIRADGTVEDLGVINYWHRNPLRRFWWKLKEVARGISRH